MSGPAAPLRQRLREIATSTMLEAAERCMVKVGLEKCTMQQIASEAGCATGTLYLYFKSKDDLFHAVVERHALGVFGAARGGLASQTDPVLRVREGLREFLRYTAEHREFFQMFFRAMPMRYRLIPGALSGQTRLEHDRYNDDERAILQQAQLAGQIRSDISVERLQQFMGDVCLSVCEEFVNTPDASLDQYIQLLWGLLSGGMGVRPQERSNA